MEKFSEYMNYMSEAAKNPAPITWVKSKKSWKGSFKIDSFSFQIIINENDDYCDDISVWEFKFTRDNSTKMVNDYKYPYIVVPTIQNAMSDFLKMCSPDVLGFVGNKDDKGRIKMYEKNAKIYSDKFDYKLYLDKSSEYYAFILYKNEDFVKCVERLINDKE